MKALKLLFFAITFFVIHPYLLHAQGGKTDKTVIENESEDPVAKQKTSKPELKTIVLPLSQHLNLPVEIDRKELIRRYNAMIDEIDQLYHSPANMVQGNKKASVAVAATDKKKEKE